MSALSLHAMNSLVHLRIAASGTQGISLSKLLSDLRPFRPTEVQADIWGRQVRSALEKAQKDRTVVAKGKSLRATPAAAKAAFRWASGKPTPVAWALLCKTCLVAKGLGCEPQHAQALRTRTGLCAVVIARGHNMAVGARINPTHVISALLWDHLEKLTKRSVMAQREARLTPKNPVARLLLSHLAGSPRNLTYDEGLLWLACRAANVEERSEKALRMAGLQRICASHTVVKAAPPPDDSLEDFAERVLVAAGQTYTGRVGADKVLISHVAKKLGENQPQALESFKQRLIEANRRGFLSLGRADLANTLPPEDVRDSEIAHFTARFHLIRLQPKGGQP